jgi:hypothetical protein
MSAKQPLVLAAVVVAALATVAVVGWLQGETTPDVAADTPAAVETQTGTPEIAPVAIPQLPAPAPTVAPPTRSSMLPGRYPMKVPFSDSGARTPQGTYVPLLNGVPHAPPMQRNSKLGPVPPIDSKIIDHTGLEWWEHADHSTTTTRWTEIKTYDPKTGQTTVQRQVETVHGAFVPEGFANPPPQAGGGEAKPPSK